MTIKSCGAIFYAFGPDNTLGIILGDENRSQEDGWLPFKGGVQPGETLEETATREIFEETCGLVYIENISLDHKFSTKRKEYHIGLCEVPYDIIEQFNTAIKKEIRTDFLEKRSLRFFKYPDILTYPYVHNISKASVLFYKNKLDDLLILANNPGLRARLLGMSNSEAQRVKDSLKPTSPEQTDADSDSSGSNTSGSAIDSDKRWVSERVRSLKTRQTRQSRQSRRTRNENPSKNKTILSRPLRYNITHTPRKEKMIDQQRVWRRQSPLSPISDNASRTC
jgi:ADP-ribose pyrophosphatase YjhB (NUDIX family)